MNPTTAEEMTRLAKRAEDQGAEVAFVSTGELYRWAARVEVLERDAKLRMLKDHSEGRL